jgi:hypothetical protein
MIEPQTNAEPARKIWVPAEPITNPLVKAYSDRAASLFLNRARNVSDSRPSSDTRMSSFSRR